MWILVIAGLTGSIGYEFESRADCLQAIGIVVSISPQITANCVRNVKSAGTSDACIADTSGPIPICPPGCLCPAPLEELK